MTDTNTGTLPEGGIVDEVHKAISELDNAIEQGENAADEGADPALAPRVKREVSKDGVAKLRQNAAKARERGFRSLSRSQAGIAGLQQDIIINERVVSSAFLRYYSAIESGCYAIWKHGEMFVGHARATEMRDKIRDRILLMVTRAKEDLGLVENDLKVLTEQKGDKLVKPVYSEPATKIDAMQIKLPETYHALTAVKSYDEALSGLQVLHWNLFDSGMNTESRIHDQEQRAKNELKSVANMVLRFARGMRKKVDAKDDTAAPAASAEPAADGAEEASLKAAA